MPSEDAVMDALRRFNIPSGDYLIPRAANSAEMRSAEFKEKFKRGPVAMLTFMTGEMAMGKRLFQWFVYLVVISTFAGYVAGRALGPGAPGGSVCRFAATVAFAGYGLGQWQNSIWYSRKWTTAIKYTIDSLIFGILTGLVFAWLWPKA
jgi:hypothetical protein